MKRRTTMARVMVAATLLGPVLGTVALGADMRIAVVDMQRALNEYVVAGIRTTIPFFSWLLAQHDFLAGRFHTAYLDEVLVGRNGRPFVEADEATQNVAAIAAALRAVLSPETAVAAADGQPAETDRRWKAQARAEGLR